MTSHELANLLLAGPDLPVVSGLDRTGYGEAVEAATVVDAFAYEEGKGWQEPASVVELSLSENSSHSSCPEDAS